jgi:putative hemolysin
MSNAVQTLAHALVSAAEGLVRPGRDYRIGLVRSATDLRAVQALRFDVFNLELDEGLVDSYDTGLDADPFDAQCEHLMVQEAASGAVVGTYRMQTGLRAARGLGYYSQREFDFAPFEAERPRILELGRACIHAQHRNFAVLNLLWKGIAAYARSQGARYLLGCSSLTTQNPALGLAAWHELQAYHAAPEWLTRPMPGFECLPGADAVTPPRVPRLLSAYLAVGARLCGPPAIDRDFRTVDFLTWLDLQSPAIQALQRRGRFTA